MIISLSGLIGSGKDTVATILVEKFGFMRHSWAGNLKNAVSSIFGWDRQLLEGISDESRIWREQKDEFWSKKLGFDVIPRKILQQFGTEVCRGHFHENIWVTSLAYKLRQYENDVVVTDTRFGNEIETIKELGGHTWRIKRGLDPEWVYDYTHKTSIEDFVQKYPNIHPSEYLSLDFEYDVTIHNNYSIHKLQEKISNYITNYKSNQ